MKLNSLLYYRSKLDAHDQAIYDDLFQHWMHLDDNFTIDIPHCDLSVLTRAVHWDNPILFYIDYYKICYVQTRTHLHVEGGYLYERNDIERYLDDCEKWGRRVMRMLPSLGTAEQALWLHDLVIANVRYGDSLGVRAHNMIGVIKDKEAVCEGIAKVYKFLCDLANIPCIFVSGELNHSPHAWNMLWVGGGTSFVDVTNDIHQGGCDHTNFLRSAAEMSGYEWDRALIPACKIRNLDNAFFTVRNKEELADTLRKNAQKDSLCIHLQFGHDLNAIQINTLITQCSLSCPTLMTREISYSLERQIIHIK